jgi:hypothetical protein
MSGVTFGDIGGEVDIGGDVVGRDKITHPAQRSNAAWRDEVIIALNQSDLDDVDRLAARDTVDALKMELDQERPSPSRLQHYLNVLAEMGPDILDVVVAAARGPFAVVGVTIEKISDHAVEVQEASA